MVLVLLHAFPRSLMIPRVLLLRSQRLGPKGDACSDRDAVPLLVQTINAWRPSPKLTPFLDCLGPKGGARNDRVQYLFLYKTFLPGGPLQTFTLFISCLGPKGDACYNRDTASTFFGPNHFCLLAFLS